MPPAKPEALWECGSRIRLDEAYLTLCALFSQAYLSFRSWSKSATFMFQTSTPSPHLQYLSGPCRYQGTLSNLFSTDPLSGRRPSLCMQMTLLSCMSAAWLVRSQLSSDKPVSNQDVRSLFRKSDAVLPLLGQSQRNKGH